MVRPKDNRSNNIAEHTAYRLSRTKNGRNTSTTANVDQLREYIESPTQVDVWWTERCFSQAEHFIHSLEPTFSFSGTMLTITRNALTGKCGCRCWKSYSSPHSLLRHNTSHHDTVNAEELSAGETIMKICKYTLVTRLLRVFQASRT